MSQISTLGRPVSVVPAHDPDYDVGVIEAIASESFSKDRKDKHVRDSVLIGLIAEKQIMRNDHSSAPSAGELESSINAYQPTEDDWQDLVGGMSLVDDEVRNDLMFDPGAWEKHANVLVAAIIALNLSRVANAQLRGHFSVMAADAAKAQGAAIADSGKAALYSAIAAAMVSGVIASFAMFNTLQGQGLKHADINLHKRTSLDAGNTASDLRHHRGRDDWNPETTYKIKTFDDFARSTSVDFKPKGTLLTPQEQAWFDGEILKAQKIGQTSDWLSQMGGKGIEKKLEIGRALNAMSMNFSQVVSSIVRLSEHAAREREVLQQSAQNTQKSLSDEVGQKDAAEQALLQKLMEMVLQLFQSRTQVIRDMTA